jgi:hypothetical protein
LTTTGPSLTTAAGADFISTAGDDGPDTDVAAGTFDSRDDRDSAVRRSLPSGRTLVFADEGFLASDELSASEGPASSDEPPLDELGPSDEELPGADADPGDEALPGADADPGDEPPLDELGPSDELPEPVSSANATGIHVVIAAPMPNATASAPTRPI